MNLIAGIQEDLATLRKATAEMRERGIAYAQADAAYRAAKAKAILEEKAAGTPATIARDVIYAREDVINALLERDCAEALLDSVREGIQATKLQIRIQESQLEREWEQANRM